MVLLAGFAHQEGFFKFGSRPQRNNNPLDLVAGDEASRFGAIKNDGRFAIFPDIDTGWMAGKRWLSIPAKLHEGEIAGYYFDPNGTTLVGGYLGATIAQVVYRFAPPHENDTEAYINYLCTNVPELTRHTILTLDLLELPNVTGTT